MAGILTQGQVFKSKAIEEASKLGKVGTATVAQWRKTLLNKGVKKEELDYLGLGDSENKLSHESLMEIMNGRQFVPQEMVLKEGATRDPFTVAHEMATHAHEEEIIRRRRAGYDELSDEDNESLFSRFLEMAQDDLDPEDLTTSGPNNARHASYKTPGGENYRELILTDPQSQAQKGLEWEHGHWRDIANPVLHLRMQDFPEKDMTYAEEMQSDMHQQGRKFGYRRQLGPDEVALLEQQYREARDYYSHLSRGVGAERERLYDYLDSIRDLATEAAHDNPAVYPSLLAEGEAAHGRLMNFRENLTNPDHPYNLARAQRDLRENDLLEATGSAGRPYKGPWADTWHDKALQRLVSEAVDTGRENIGFTTGDVQLRRWSGQGPGQMYDTVLLPKAEKLAKQYGSAVLRENIGPANTPSYTMKVTPQMKEAAMKGWPLFVGVGAGILAGLLTPHGDAEAAPRFHLTRYNAVHKGTDVMGTFESKEEAMKALEAYAKENDGWLFERKGVKDTWDMDDETISLTEGKPDIMPKDDVKYGDWTDIPKMLEATFVGTLGPDGRYPVDPQPERNLFTGAAAGILGAPVDLTKMILDSSRASVGDSDTTPDEPILGSRWIQRKMGGDPDQPASAWGGILSWPSK